MKDPQGRKWLLTINEPLKKGWTHGKIKDTLAIFSSVSYYCMADEQGAQEKTLHTHIFFVSDSPIRFSTIKTRFQGAHIDRAVGNSWENQAYVAKTGKWESDEKAETSIPGTFEEWGQLSPAERQGERTDLARLYEMIKDGLSNFELMEKNPDYLMSLDKVERARQAVREQQYRDTFRVLESIYIWGKTGTGKTKGVMEKHGYSGVYRVTDYAHPFDSYMGEDVLAMEEFNSNNGIKIQDMLNYLDGYPLTLPARYANKVACYTKVYIISNICLSKQYTDVQHNSPATYAALLRRIHKVVYYSDVGVFQEYTTNEYMDNPFLRERG